MTDSTRTPSFIEAFIPVIVLIGLLAFNVYVFKDDATGGPNQIALLFGAVIASAIGIGQGFSWKMIQDGIERGVRRFEFGDGDLHYKTLWGAGVEGCRRTYLAVPNRLVGCAASAAHRVRQWVTSTNAQAEEVAATEVADRSPVTARA